ncbi:MAG: S1C family serine protease [bacterium]|nr:S1C family serine protease [bacterium]
MLQRTKHPSTPSDAIATPLERSAARAGRSGWIAFTGIVALLAGIAGGLIGMTFLVPVPQSVGAPPVVGRTRGDNARIGFPAIAPLAAAVVELFDAQQAATLGDRVGRGVTLTSDGWIVTVRGALPPAKRGSVPAAAGRDRVLHAAVRAAFDPLSDLVFLRTPTLAASVIPLCTDCALAPGTPLFAPTEDGGLTALRLRARHVRRGAGILRSSDQWETLLAFDGSARLAPGTPIVNTDGALVGLVLADDVAIPVDAIASALPQLFRGGTVIRNGLGVTYRDRAELVMRGDGSAAAPDGAEIAVPLRGTAFAAGSPLAGRVEIGTVVRAVGGDPLTARRFLAELLQEYPLGASVSLVMSRPRVGDGAATETIEVPLMQVTGETMTYAASAEQPRGSAAGG